MERFTGILGILAILLVCVLFSKHKRAIRPSLIFWGLGLQLAFAFIVLRTPAARIFEALSDKVNAIIAYSQAGSKFVFGDQLGGAPTAVFAFQVLPIIIFICSLFAILYYLGVMQVLVNAMAVVMQSVMGASGAESTNVGASILMLQTEAPITIRPFLEGLTESELFTIMVSGMAHVSGATMAAYVLMAHVEIRHLLTAVIMTAPATIMLAKILVPEIDRPATMGDVKIEVERPGVNIIDAAARGAGDGLQLALNIGAMLVAFIGLIALCKGMRGSLHQTRLFYWVPSTMQAILGHVFAPVAWLLGVKYNDCATVGNLLGTRMILNEFVAFVDLGKVSSTLDPRSFVISTYALCGF